MAAKRLLKQHVQDAARNARKLAHQRLYDEACTERGFDLKEAKDAKYNAIVDLLIGPQLKAMKALPANFFPSYSGKRVLGTMLDGPYRPAPHWLESTWNLGEDDLPDHVDKAKLILLITEYTQLSNDLTEIADAARTTAGETEALLTSYQGRNVGSLLEQWPEAREILPKEIFVSDPHLPAVMDLNGKIGLPTEKAA